ncbi:MAG: PAS domain S-box protein [Hyphomicrobiaceae bacterium]|nr:MAG: PAS domain S-box protein [Hyphomicrobiaceae bacterium]
MAFAFMTAQDIPGQRGFEEALRTSERRLAAILEALPIGVAFLDAGGQLVVTNSVYKSYVPGAVPSWSETEQLRWEAHDAEGRRIPKSGFPAARALQGERVWPGQEFLFHGPGQPPRWATVAALPFLDEANEVAGVTSIILDIDREKRALLALTESEERFRKFAEASSDVLWIRRADDLQWEYLSPAFDTIYGEKRSETLKGDNLKSWLELIIEEDRDRAIAELRKVRSGVNVTFEYRIRRPSDGQIRWLRNTDFPILNEKGEVQRIGGIGQDVTEEKETAERLQVLVAELQHRTRNLLAVVRSITRQTISSSTNIEALKVKMDDRLAALSRVQGLLSRSDPSPIDVSDLVRMEIDAVAPNRHLGQIVLVGPRIPLPGSVVQTLALALHELSTNALKYGALSCADGRLKVTWHRSGAGRLVLDWAEEGFEPKSRQRLGYGRELIEKALPYTTGAETTFDLSKGGLHCRITLPLARARA